MATHTKGQTKNTKKSELLMNSTQDYISILVHTTKISPPYLQLAPPPTNHHTLYKATLVPLDQSRLHRCDNVTIICGGVSAGLPIKCPRRPERAFWSVQTHPGGPASALSLTNPPGLVSTPMSAGSGNVRRALCVLESVTVHCVVCECRRVSPWLLRGTL